MDRLEHLLIRKRAKMKAIQEDMKATIIASQEKIGTVISAIQSTQTKCQEAISERMGDLDAEIQGTWWDEEAVRTTVDKETQSLCEDLDMQIQATWIDVQAAKTVGSHMARVQNEAGRC